MRSLIVATLAGAVAFLPSAASADPHDGWRQLEDKQRECTRDLRRAEGRRNYIHRLRECRREIAQTRRQLIREHYRDRDRDHDGDRDRRWDD